MTSYHISSPPNEVNKLKYVMRNKKKNEIIKSKKHIEYALNTDEFNY